MNYGGSTIIFEGLYYIYVFTHMHIYTFLFLKLFFYFMSSSIIIYLVNIQGMMVTFSYQYLKGKCPTNIPT